MRILIVEDTPKLSALLTDTLGEAGFETDQAYTASEALDALSDDMHDLAVLDLGLPDKDGLDVLKEVRSNKNMIPVLILTAREKLDDKLHGLNLGADDYLVKPFEMQELIARVRALLRRPATAIETLITIDNLKYDTVNRVATVNGEHVNLSKREVDVFEQLVRSEGRVVPKEKIEKAIYSYGGEGSPNSVEVIIHRLRKKLQRHRAKPQVHTLRGIGYMIISQNEQAKL